MTSYWRARLRELSAQTDARVKICEICEIPPEPGPECHFADNADFVTGAPAASGDAEPAALTGRPAAWAAALAGLDPDLPPLTVPPGYWRHFLDDAAVFLPQWGARAEALGWTALDLFGADPVRPYARLDQAGLVWLLDGSRVVAMTDAATPARVVDYLLRDSDDQTVVVGPVVWQPSDGLSSRRWYFTVATSEAGRGFRCDSIAGGEAERGCILAELARRGPLIVHLVDDELAMARLCAALWPGPRIAALVRQIEAERAAA